jgi:hypothetical protein
MQESENGKTEIEAEQPAAKNVSRRPLSSKMKLLFGGAALLAVLAVYLGVSFGIKNVWDKTWLIWVIGVAVIGIVFLLDYVSKIVETKLVLSRMITLGIIVLISAVAYICLEVLTEAPSAYVLFLLMVILLFGAETSMLYVMGSKYAFASLNATVPVVFGMVYVILSVMKITTWHPYWYLILIGVGIDAVLIAVKFLLKKKKKQ